MNYGKIKGLATLCTDKMNSYVRFANANKIELVQLKTGKSKKGIYHIQHINAYHSQLKKFVSGFNGVSTKYLNIYLVWNNWRNTKDMSLKDKAEMLLKRAISSTISIKNLDLSHRPNIPVA